jgi:alkylation response protein AidB-like acyl-CoA dehydrogenase
VVEHLADADVIFVLKRDGVFRLEPGAVVADALPMPFDPLTPVARVTVLAGGEQVGDRQQARDWRIRGSMLASAMLVGIADAACRLGTAYAKTREQFDRPIGSFQALQHMLADTYAATEIARAAVYAAAATADDPGESSLERAVAVARISAARAAIQNAKTCIQVHGGMGFTWEVDPHLLLKRAWVLSTAFGSPDDAAATVAAHLVTQG